VQAALPAPHRALHLDCIGRGSISQRSPRGLRESCQGKCGTLQARREDIRV